MAKEQFRTSMLQSRERLQKNKLLEFREKSSTLFRSTLFRPIENGLTPGQIQRINEMLLATMGEFSMISPISPCTFEALDLTDLQRQEMERIKRELEPEIEKYVEDFVENLATMGEKMKSEIEKQGGDHRESELAIRKRLIKEDPVFRKIHTEFLSRPKSFKTLFKKHVFDVLTDEQRNRLQELIDNPPEHAKIFLKIVQAWSFDASESR